MLKRSNLCLLVVMVSLLLTVNCSAQSRGFKQGNVEISVMGSYSVLDLKYASTVEIFSLSGSCGFFFTDTSEISFKGIGIWADVDGVDISSTGIGVDYKYHFNMPGLKPYIGFQFMALGADITIEDLEGDADGSMYGPLIGLKYFLTNSAILTGEVQYQILGGDLEDVYEKSAEATLGMSFLF